jgi:hypothetical protein
VEVLNLLAFRDELGEMQELKVRGASSSPPKETGGVVVDCEVTTTSVGISGRVKPASSVRVRRCEKLHQVASEDKLWILRVSSD